MTALIRAGSYVVEAHASWGHWAARCGYCPHGEMLRRFTPHFQCPECGMVTEVIWPSADMVAGVERLLMMRPAPANRNWMPGETLHDLMFENGAHGIFDHLTDQLAFAPGESPLIVEDERIRVDNLPALKPRIRQEITQ